MLSITWGVVGSKKDESVGKDNTVSSTSVFERQILLLSATLNDKVNHLAKISLENPVMIGLDDKMVQPISLPEHSGSDGDKTEHLFKLKGPSGGDYNLPAQLNQSYVKGL